MVNRNWLNINVFWSNQCYQVLLHCLFYSIPSSFSSKTFIWFRVIQFRNQLYLQFYYFHQCLQFHPNHQSLIGGYCMQEIIFLSKNWNKAILLLLSWYLMSTISIPVIIHSINENQDCWLKTPIAFIWNMRKLKTRQSLSFYRENSEMVQAVCEYE